MTRNAVKTKSQDEPTDKDLEAVFQHMKRERNYGIDLLRMLFMFFVISTHALGAGGVLHSLTPYTLGYELAWIMELIGISCVNVYAMISGYFGYGSKTKYSSVVSLWLMVVYYTVLITAIFAIINPGTVGIRDFIDAVLPISAGHYWYFSAYVFLFLFTPLINSAIERLSQGELKLILISFFVFFCVLQCITGQEPSLSSGGYSCIWLMVMYIFGGYLAKYEVLKKFTGKGAVTGLVISVFVGLGMENLLEFLGTSEMFSPINGYASLYQGELIYHYCPFMIAISFFMFVSFSKIKVANWLQRVMKVFVPAAFSVYIIHGDPRMWDILIQDKFFWTLKYPAVIMILLVIAQSFGIYFACLVVDQARLWIFAKLKVKDRLSALEERIRAKV